MNSDWEEMTPTKLATEGLQAKKGWQEDQPASQDMRSAMAAQ